MIGFAIDGFVLAEDLPLYKTLIQQTGTGTGRGEIRLAARDGARVSVHLSISSFAAETPHSVCVVVTDLTEHKRHQQLVSSEALERTRRTEAEAGEGRIRGVLESITDSFFSVDRSWRITEVNIRAVGHLGRSRAELLGSCRLGRLSAGDDP